MTKETVIGILEYMLDRVRNGFYGGDGEDFDEDCFDEDMNEMMDEA